LRFAVPRLRSSHDGSVLEAAAKDPEIKKTLIETAVTAEREMITPFLQWRYNGRPTEPAGIHR
jgi:hypothetical protein